MLDHIPSDSFKKAVQKLLVWLKLILLSTMLAEWTSKSSSNTEMYYFWFCFLGGLGFLFFSIFKNVFFFFILRLMAAWKDSLVPRRLIGRSWCTMSATFSFVLLCKSKSPLRMWTRSKQKWLLKALTVPLLSTLINSSSSAILWLFLIYTWIAVVLPFHTLSGWRIWTTLALGVLILSTRRRTPCVFCVSVTSVCPLL